MDIYVKLKEDHQKVKSLLENLARTTNDEARLREELFNEVYKGIQAHSKAEEKDFYNELRRFEEDEDLQELLNHSVEEHAEVENLLTKLSATDSDTDEWMENFKELKENFEHHVEEEENKLFAMAREHLSDVDESTLGNKLEVDERDMSQSLSL